VDKNPHFSLCRRNAFLVSPTSESAESTKNFGGKDDFRPRPCSSRHGLYVFFNFQKNFYNEDF
jgi:hypothetical protein